MGNWFINRNRLKGYKPSVAEKRISSILVDLGFYFEQEISFHSCISYSGSLLIFDFIIPSLSTLIEYDGSHHESDSKTILNDHIKNEFAIQNKYTLIRLNKTNWYTLKEDIRSKLYGIKGSLINKNDSIKAGKTKRLETEFTSRKDRFKKSLKNTRVSISDYNRFNKKE